MDNKPCIPIIIIAALLLIIAGFLALKTTISKFSQPEKQYLVAGVNTPFPPFTFKNGENVIGFDIDIAQRIAKGLNRKLMIKDMEEFDALLPSLQAGNFDIVLSAVTIRPDRKEVVDFSVPYYSASQGILVKKGGKLENLRFSQPQDLAGLRLAYEKGSTSESWIKENIIGKMVAESYVSSKDMPYIIHLLKFGGVDAVIIDKPAAEYFAANNSDLAVAGEIKTNEEYGVAVVKGDPKKLLPVINKTIKEIKENGEYQKFLEKWFGGAK